MQVKNIAEEAAERLRATAVPGLVAIARADVVIHRKAAVDDRTAHHDIAALEAVLQDEQLLFDERPDCDRVSRPGCRLAAGRRHSRESYEATAEQVRAH